MKFEEILILMELLLQKTYRTDQEDVGFNMRQAAWFLCGVSIKSGCHVALSAIMLIYESGYKTWRKKNISFEEYRKHSKYGFNRIGLRKGCSLFSSKSYKSFERFINRYRKICCRKREHFSCTK